MVIWLAETLSIGLMVTKLLTSSSYKGSLLGFSSLGFCGLYCTFYAFYGIMTEDFPYRGYLD